MAPNSNQDIMWIEEMEANFIDLIKEKENLWDPQHQFYVNSRLKQCDYKDIGKTLRSKWPEHTSLFTLTNLTDKFLNLKNHYKREWKNQKSRNNDKEEKSTPEWEHYQRLNFLEHVISAETEQADNVPQNDSDEISRIYENLESSLIGNVSVKMEVDDSVQTEPTSILPDISTPVCGSGAANINTVRTDENIGDINNLDFRLKQSNSCSTSDCNLLHMKAFETIKEALNRTNSIPCTCSNDADVAFGRYMGSVLSTIPNSQRKETLKMKIMEIVSKASYSKMSEKYTVVKLEDGIQLIPTCWLTEDESQCYWPNCTSSSKLNCLVEKLTEPNKKSWILHKVLRIFGTSDDYKKGLKKMKQCITDVNITTSSGAGNRKRRRRYPKDSASDESEIDEDQISQQDTFILPDRPPKRKVSISDSHAESLANISSFGRKIPRYSAPSTSFGQASDNNKSLLSLKKSTKTEDKMQLMPNKSSKEFMEIVVQMFNSISRRLNSLEDPMLSCKANMEKDPDVLSDIMKIFPIGTDEQMDNLEIFLSDDENEKLMIAALKVVGGSGDDQLITNVLKRCISDGVAELYSWLGAKQKKALKSLKFSSVMFQCVRHHSQTITEDKFSAVVSNWLRHAKQRRERQETHPKSHF